MAVGPGTHFIIPFIDTVTIYSTALRQYTMAADDAIVVRTRDGHPLSVEYSFIYHIDPDRAGILHARWGTRFDMDFVRPVVRAAVYDAFARYTEEEFGRDYSASAESLQAQVKQALSPIFYENGLILDRALLRNISFRNEFVATMTAEPMAHSTATASANQK